MLKLLYVLILFCSVANLSLGQKCVHDDERIILEAEIEANRIALKKSGKLHSNRRMPQPVLKWPLRQANGISDPGYHTISNYVDVNPNDTILGDYNCGTRTYEGHRGIDIAITPFDWNKVATNEVEVIAAAGGVIIKKQDNQFDQHCFRDSTASWNLIVIEHSDGSTTWYGHMKTGFLTQKDTGEVVVTGEYLGVVASSGKSTGPHLHFEVHNWDNVITDPFGGACNPNGVFSSWWETQPKYTDSAINKLMTSEQPYNTMPCPQLADIFEEDVYNPGDSIFFSAHYRHDLTSNETRLTAISPDGNISPILDTTYSRTGSSFVKSWDVLLASRLPINAMKGKWKFKARYDTSISGVLNYEKEFWVKETCTVDKTLSGTHSVDRYYATTNSLSSTATVLVGKHIVYNPENFTVLNPGFQARAGSKVEVKTEGCN
jgi:murein DD-endopeptidase MepM/ murein hydrolase activator NlpD